MFQPKASQSSHVRSEGAAAAELPNNEIADNGEIARSEIADEIADNGEIAIGEITEIAGLPEAGYFLKRFL